MRRTCRGRAETLIAVLSLLVVISMVLGTLLSVLPQRERPAQPTPTATVVLNTPTPAEPPTLTPTPPIQPTPQPTP